MLTTKLYLPFGPMLRQAHPRTRAIYSAHLLWSKRYPQWSEAFFDRHFLRTRVIPLLVNCQVDPTIVDPVSLAQEWVDQFPGTENHRHRLIGELTPAIADFLQFVVAEERYFVSEATSSQAKLNKHWVWLPLRGVVRSMIKRLERRHSQSIADGG